MEMEMGKKRGEGGKERRGKARHIEPACTEGRHTAKEEMLNQNPQWGRQ